MSLITKMTLTQVEVEENDPFAAPESEVTHRITEECLSLDVIAERLTYFIKACGFHYITGVTIHKHHGDASFIGG